MLPSTERGLRAIDSRNGSPSIPGLPLEGSNHARTGFSRDYTLPRGVRLLREPRAEETHVDSPMTSTIREIDAARRALGVRASRRRKFEAESRGGCSKFTAVRGAAAAANARTSAETRESERGFTAESNASLDGALFRRRDRSRPLRSRYGGSHEKCWTGSWRFSLANGPSYPPP